MKKIKNIIGLFISAISLYALAFGLGLIEDEKYFLEFQNAMREMVNQR
jgi:hypothetical protein